jgi:hypothetical protein
VADDAGEVSRVDAEGRVAWTAEAGVVSHLAACERGVFAAGWDGRLRGYGPDGARFLAYDLTAHLARSMPEAAEAQRLAAEVMPLYEAHRPASLGEALRASPNPALAQSASGNEEGENLLASGRAKLTLGGIRSWMSDGTVQVEAAALTNGVRDDVTTPWLHLDEVFWDASAGRQVWAEIEFAGPTEVQTLTVYENPAFPDSFPTEAAVLVWNEAGQRWDTARFGVFLEGPVRTFQLGLKDVKKLRYVPWKSYYRNFYTSELEVRGRM